MANREASRCKECKAPLLSAVEQGQGKCTACLRSERMQTARRVAHAVTGTEPQTPSSLHGTAGDCILDPLGGIGETADPITSTRPGGSCIPDLNSDQANSVLLSFRVSPTLAAKLDAHLERTKQAKSAYLRAILDDSLQ